MGSDKTWKVLAKECVKRHILESGLDKKWALRSVKEKGREPHGAK